MMAMSLMIDSRTVWSIGLRFLLLGTGLRTADWRGERCDYSGSSHELHRQQRRPPSRHGHCLVPILLLARIVFLYSFIYLLLLFLICNRMLHLQLFAYRTMANVWLAHRMKVQVLPESVAVHLPALPSITSTFSLNKE